MVIPGATPCILVRLTRQSNTQGSKLPGAAAFPGYILDWLMLPGKNEWFEASSSDSSSSPSQRHQLLPSCPKDQDVFFELSVFLLLPRVISFLWIYVLSHRSNSLGLGLTPSYSVTLQTPFCIDVL